MRYFGVSEERAIVIAAPPLQQFFAEEADDQFQVVRERLQLPDRFLFYPAQFWPHKNHLRLIEAFREVVKEVPDLSWFSPANKRDEYRW